VGTATLAVNGFTWIPNGLILQWFTATAVNSTSHFWAYPTAMPTGTYSVVGTGNFAGSNNYIAITTSNTTGCNAASACTLNESVSFIAIGH